MVFGLKFRVFLVRRTKHLEDGIFQLVRFCASSHSKLFSRKSSFTQSISSLVFLSIKVLGSIFLRSKYYLISWSPFNFIIHRKNNAYPYGFSQFFNEISLFPLVFNVEEHSPDQIWENLVARIGKPRVLLGKLLGKQILRLHILQLKYITELAFFLDQI